MWKIRDFFKNPFAFFLPHVYRRRQSRRERRWNAYCKPFSTPAACPGRWHNPVKRSCIFCIKIWPASIPYSFFAGLIPMIRVSPSLLGLSSHTAAWIICTCIIRFTFKPLIDIDFSVTLRCFTWQLLKTTKLPYDINIDFSRRLPPNYHKKWLLTKKTVRLWADFWKSVIFF